MLRRHKDAFGVQKANELLLCPPLVLYELRQRDNLFFFGKTAPFLHGFSVSQLSTDCNRNILLFS
jgi:hypothetical protein